VNGQVVTTASAPGTGQILVSVSAGHSDVEVSFARTRDRTIGSELSFLGVALCGGIVLMHKRNSAPRRRSDDAQAQ
jgi:hypothetical protein